MILYNENSIRRTTAREEGKRGTEEYVTELVAGDKQREPVRVKYNRRRSSMNTKP